MNKLQFALQKAEEFMRINDLTDFDTYALIKEALEQPARLVSYAPDGSTCTLNIDGEEVYFNREQQAQEPVAWTDEYKNFLEWDKESLCDKAVCKDHEAIPLYTHPAPSWQGLSDDEIKALDLDNDVISVISQVEQALRTKNEQTN